MNKNENENNNSHAMKNFRADAARDFFDCLKSEGRNVSYEVKAELAAKVQAILEEPDDAPIASEYTTTLQGREYSLPL
jgi:hypothetical protein